MGIAVRRSRLRGALPFVTRRSCRRQLRSCESDPWWRSRGHDRKRARANARRATMKAPSHSSVDAFPIRPRAPACASVGTRDVEGVRRARSEGHKCDVPAVRRRGDACESAVIDKRLARAFVSERNLRNRIRTAWVDRIDLPAARPITAVQQPCSRGDWPVQQASLCRRRPNGGTGREHGDEGGSPNPDPEPKQPAHHTPPSAAQSLGLPR